MDEEASEEDVIIINSEEDDPRSMEMEPDACDDYVGYEDFFGLEDNTTGKIKDTEMPESLCVSRTGENNDIYLVDDGDEIIENNSEELKAEKEEDGLTETEEEATSDPAVSLTTETVAETRAHSSTENSLQKKKFIFKCELCDFSTGIRFALARHAVQHSGEVSKTALGEPYLTSIISNNSAHNEIKKRFFKCPHQDCAFRSTTRFVINKHLLTHSENPKASPKTVKCIYCFSVFARNKGLNLHILHIHKDKTEKCDQCHTRVAVLFKSTHVCRRNKITESSTRKLKEIELQGSEGELERRNCTYKTANREQFSTHKDSGSSSDSSKSSSNMQRHTLTRVDRSDDLKCNYCEFKPFSVRSLRIHVSKSHVDRCRRCNDCFKLIPIGTEKEHSSTCVKSKALKRKSMHQKLHTAGKSKFMKCKKCSYKGTKMNVTIHVKKMHFAEAKSKTEQMEGPTGRGVVREDDQTSEDRVKKLHLFKCRVCLFTTKFQFLLNQHMASHSEGNFKQEDIKETKFKCDQCPFSSNHSYNLKKHRKLHNRKPPIQQEGCKSSKRHYNNLIQCPQCDYKGTSNALKYHLKSIHASNIDKVEQIEDTLNTIKNLNCKECSYSTTIGRRLEKHYMQHRAGKVVTQCPHCDYRSTKDVLKFHLKAKHSLIWSLSRRHKCQECSYRAITISALKSHKRAHLNGLPVIQCPESNCDYKSTPRPLTFHLKSIHAWDSDKIYLIIKKEFKCNECSYIAYKMQSLKNHQMMRHKGSIIKQCPHCDYKSTYHALRVHLKANHSINRKGSVEVQCEYCSHTCLPQYLKNHLLQHTEKKVPLLKCEQCNYVSSKRLLCKHVKSAHSSTPSPALNCKYCSFIAKTTSAICSHTKWHTVFKKPIYKCDFCDYVSIKFCLKRHVKINHHQREKHFCEMCPYETTLLFDLENHVHIHKDANIAFFHCPKCPYRSSTVNVINHCLREHKLEINPEQLMKSGEANKTKADLDNQILQKFMEKTDLKGDDCYRCKVCSATTRFRFQMKAHLNTHAELFSAQTKTSPASVQEVSTVEKDPRETSGDRSEPIEIVQTLISNPVSKDKLTVSNNVVFICELCDFATQSKEALLRHKEDHSESVHTLKSETLHDKKTVKSDKAKSPIGSINNVLTNSEKSVESSSSAEAVKCQECCRTFKNVFDFSRHTCDLDSEKCKIDHINNKTLYCCQLCSFQTKYPLCLKKHLNTRHRKLSTNSFGCPFCSHIASSKSELRKHIFTKHSVEDADDPVEQSQTININEMTVYKNKTYNVEIKKSEGFSSLGTGEKK